MPKEFTCAKCGVTVSKRKSRLVGKERICKEHDEAKEFAEKDRAVFIEKMNKARQETQRMTNRHHRVDPIRQLASFSVLGQLYRAQQEARAAKEAQAIEMLECNLKSKAYSLFFHTLNNHKGSTDEKRAVIEKSFSDFRVELVGLVDTEEAADQVGKHWDAVTLGFIDELFSRFSGDDVVKQANAVIGEWKQFDKRADELFDILYPGVREEEEKHREMLDEQAELST